MDSNSSSRQSYSGEKQQNPRKRIRKQVYKDKDGSYSDESSSSRSKPGYSYQGDAQTNQRPTTNYKRPPVSQSVSDSNNGYASDEEVSNGSPRKKISGFRKARVIEEDKSLVAGIPEQKQLRLKVRKLDEEKIYRNIVGLLQTDERVKIIIKSKQLAFKVIRYEYNKKRHFLSGSDNTVDLTAKEQEEYNEIIDSMLEKFESLHLMGFESIKYLEEQLLMSDKSADEHALNKLRFMSFEEWERSLTTKERTKMHKRAQDQKKVIRRILETDLGLIEEQDVYNEIKYNHNKNDYHKPSDISSKFLPSLRFTKSVSAPDFIQSYGGMENTGNQFSTPFNYGKPILGSPQMRRFGTSVVADPHNQPFRQPGSEFEGNDGFNMNRDSNTEGYRPYYYRPSMPHMFLDECCYNIDRKKLKYSITENIDRYFEELPNEVKYAEVGIDQDTEKLRDSTYSSRDRHSSSNPSYNYDLLNELHSKVKSCDDVSIGDLKLIIFLIQRTISDMKSVGRAGQGYKLSAYELRRRGFKVNPKELLDLLKRLCNR